MTERVVSTNSKWRRLQSYYNDTSLSINLNKYNTLREEIFMGKHFRGKTFLRKFIFEIENILDFLEKNLRRILKYFRGTLFHAWRILKVFNGFYFRESKAIRENKFLRKFLSAKKSSCKNFFP